MEASSLFSISRGGVRSGLETTCDVILLPPTRFTYILLSSSRLRIRVPRVVWDDATDSTNHTDFYRDGTGFLWNRGGLGVIFFASEDEAHLETRELGAET